MHEDYIGLYDIVIDSAFRKQGYGKQLITNILTLGANAGAKFSCLAVVRDNLPAVKLYSGIGYQYWYRIKRSKGCERLGKHKL